MNEGERHESLVDQLNTLLAFAFECDQLATFEDRNTLALAMRGEGK